MGFVKPPMLTGDNKKDIVNLRDYLFRIAGTLDAVAQPGTPAVSVSYQNGKPVTKPAGDSKDVEEIRQEAKRLASLIIKTGNELDKEIGDRQEEDGNTLTAANNYTDGKKTEYDEAYVSQSEYGTFIQTVLPEIIEEQTNSVYVQKTEYDIALENINRAIDGLDGYREEIAGEIMRGIVLDPSTGLYVTGIAIAEEIVCKGEISPEARPYVPDDGHIYVEIDQFQTFGLYTSTGWQFWVKGNKVGWFTSEDSGEALHVRSAKIEEAVTVGGAWQQKTETINGVQMFTINYIGS